jgi:hypothetical protein
MFDTFTARVLHLALTLADGVRQRADSTDPERDRGDVPGWVMITLMTAIVVISLLAVFQNQVVDAVKSAFASITSKGG